MATVLLLATLSIALWKSKRGHATPSRFSMAPPALQPVAVARVARAELYEEVRIAAEFRPYLQVDLHAKVSGYLKAINVDIGDEVKAGQVLAELEMPELKDELDRALAAEKRAAADYKDAHLVYQRLLEVEKQHPNLVAQQELDAAEAKDLTAEAAISGARADVEKYQTLLGYTRITAPFRGIITARYADPGSLIQAGTASNTQSLPLVRLSDNYRLRLDFPVSVTYAKDIHAGAVVEVRVDSLGGKAMSGSISRFAKSVDDATRTMVTEVEVPNPKLELMPGMYATVLLKTVRRTNALSIPAEAVSAHRKSTVYVVNAEGKLEERPVSLGLETSTRYEVLAGLRQGDLVLVGSRSQVHPGQKVDPKLIGSLAQK